MSYTVNDLGVDVLEELGVYGAGETPSPEDMATFLRRLNAWVDALKTDRLSIYAITRQTWTISTASSYTVGSGATVNIDRPVNPQAIAAIGYQDTSVSPTLETLFDGSPLSVDAYALIPNKTLTGVYPAAWYYNPTFGTTGYGTLTPWPVPTSTTLQGVIYAPAAVGEFTALSDVIYLPPGYRRFLRTNLAIECAPTFKVKVDPATVQAASDSMAQVKRTNERLQDVYTTEAAALFTGRGGYYNIYTD